jgi:hypothetical protein
LSGQDHRRREWSTKPTNKIALAASFESGEPYAGGSGGAGTITLPSAFAPNYFNLANIGSSGFAVPSPHLDVVAKMAFDPTHLGRGTHIEVAGLVSRFAFYDTLSNLRFATTGRGISVNASTDVTSRLTFFTNNFYSHGGGRSILARLRR